MGPSETTSPLALRVTTAAPEHAVVSASTTAAPRSAETIGTSPEPTSPSVEPTSLGTFDTSPEPMGPSDTAPSVEPTSAGPLSASPEPMGPEPDKEQDMEMDADQDV